MFLPPFELISIRKFPVSSLQQVNQIIDIIPRQEKNKKSITS